MRGLHNPLLVAHRFDRSNLHLEVVRHEDDARKRAVVLDQVSELPKPGLVYVSTRKKPGEHTDAFTGRGIRVAAHHGGLRPADRQIHEDFLADRVFFDSEGYTVLSRVALEVRNLLKPKA